MNEYYYSAMESKKLQEHLTTEIKSTTVSRGLRTGVRLSEIKRAAEEQCLEPWFEGDQWWRCDVVRRQSIPNASCGDCESTVADGDATRWWNLQLERRSGTESTMTVHVCHTAQFMCKVAGYGRAMPCMQLTMSAASLNSIRCGTRSQWRSQRSGVMWSDVCAEHTSQAVAFITDSSRSSWLLAMPASVALP